MTEPTDTSAFKFHIACYVVLLPRTEGFKLPPSGEAELTQVVTAQVNTALRELVMRWQAQGAIVEII